MRRPHPRAGANATDGSVCCNCSHIVRLPACAAVRSSPGVQRLQHASRPGADSTRARPNPRRFWQCQPPGSTAPPEAAAEKTVTITVTQNLPGVPAAKVKSD